MNKCNCFGMAHCLELDTHETQMHLVPFIVDLANAKTYQDFILSQLLLARLLQPSKGLGFFKCAMFFTINIRQHLTITYTVTTP
jgi:hypothetical protein